MNEVKKWTRNPIGERRCVICRETKPLEDFHKDKSRKEGRSYRCKTCHAEWARLVDDETYAAMLLICGNACTICGGVNQNGKALAVDHDHDTGEVRGLLCDGCNRGIGFMEDDPERLRRAAAYLSAKPLPSPSEESCLPSSN
jgi:hypothetical protein